MSLQDLSDEHAWQLSQEFRLASNFSGPLNFSVGGNYLHYETEENYYVFINTLIRLLRRMQISSPYLPPYVPGVSDNQQCLTGGLVIIPIPARCCQRGVGTMQLHRSQSDLSSTMKGHNYFLSQNPYPLNSYAGFGEAYYNVASI